jgi:malonyl-CoA/methylmalonyl-CoA synthetase
LRRNADEKADKPAVIFEDSQITWGELWRAIQRPSRYISRTLGSDRQEIIDILFSNSIDFIIAYLAVIHSGHIALPLDPAYKSLELDNMIDQVKPRFIITDEEYRAKLSQKHQKSAVLLDEMITQEETTSPLRLPADKQTASLTFTSGTTGKPKAVPNTHANHIWNIKACSQVWDWNETDTLLVSLPLSHMHGIVICLSGAIYHGNTMYLHRWFDEDVTLKALASGKISFFTHAASAYVQLVAVENRDYDLSKVRLCISGAAPLPPAVWQDFKDRYGIEILETYGSSETGRIAGNRLHERVLGSPGRPMPGVELRLSDQGEVEVRSPGVFPGYFNNPEATEASMTSDGFWRTGDIAELKDGYVFLKGRLQERIRRFGYTVSPRDVEWAMQKHSKVKDVYVLGRQVPGEPNDELIYFLAGSITDEEVTDYAKANLMFAWRPDLIVHLDELPRTRSGKVSMGKLKEILA